MKQKQETILKDYADKKAELARMQEELDAMEPKVLALLEKQGFDTLREDYGTFSIVYRKRWTYTQQLADKEKEYAAIIKGRKQEEQERGIATADEVKGLSYRAYIPEHEEK